MKKNKISSELKNLQKKIKISFENEGLLIEALTHRSFNNENREQNSENNERLEFLGDAVLELITTEYLFEKYKDFKEGDLTSVRSALVRTESLAFEARQIDLGRYLLMSFGEESSGGREREYILANAFEALIGAIYQEKGYKKTRLFIEKHVCYKSDKIIADKSYIDAKSRLQSIAQEVFKITPTYELVNSEGPDHNKIFTMALMIGANKLSEGKGKSKQDAEQDAASTALDKWADIVRELAHST